VDETATCFAGICRCILVVEFPALGDRPSARDKNPHQWVFLALAMIRISDISLQRPVVKYFSYILGLCRRDPLRALVPVRPLPGFGPPPIPKSKGSLSREEKFGSGRSCTHPP